MQIPPQIETTDKSSTKSAQTRPRPLFIYGTLCAQPLLAWALTGDASNTSIVSLLVQPAKIYGYARFSLHNRDYPAVVHDDHSTVDGYLLTLDTVSQRKKLDDFEGEPYSPTAVTVSTFDQHGKPHQETVDADVYLWTGEREALTSTPWDIEAFIKDRLEDWLDLFDGMELVGEEDDLWPHPAPKPRPFSLPAQQQLPTKAVALELVKETFSNYNRFLPLFDEDDFLKEFQLKYSTSNPGDASWSACLNVVLSIAHRLRALRTLYPTHENILASRYIQNALGIVSELSVSNRSLSVVQALVGMAYILHLTVLRVRVGAAKPTGADILPWTKFS
ncbi:hypothetical protein BJ170DRAFT_698703 [Xylariales sp. AK1849]|nr:hypothetical protein BJ170DRAFT_698703 [Xylariales sp. AK1849]